MKVGKRSAQRRAWKGIATPRDRTRLFVEGRRRERRKRRLVPPR